MRQAGMSLPELLIGIAVLAVVMNLAGLAVLPWIAAESSRSTIHEAGMLLQRTKAEALSRNHKCRFLVDVGQREMRVMDGNGTTVTTDDLVVVRRRLPATIGFARPDPGSPITFTALSGSLFEVVFDSAGRVDLCGVDVVAKEITQLAMELPELRTVRLIE